MRAGGLSARKGVQGEVEGGERRGEPNIALHGVFNLPRIRLACRFAAFLQVTDVISGWVTAPISSANSLSLKDRAAFVLKMARFEAVASPELHTRYLRMVLRLHVDPSLRRPELVEQIKPVFMFGLRSKQSELRDSFFELLHRAAGKSLSQRLSHIVTTQEWDALSNTLWLRQA